MGQRPKRSYLTNGEAISFGTFIESDARRLLKKREAEPKIKEGLVGFNSWVIAMRTVTKHDLKLWKQLYYDHDIRDFNDIRPIIEILDSNT